MFDWGKKKAAADATKRATAPAENTLVDKIKLRFPPDILFRVPAHARDSLKDKVPSLYAGYNEDVPEFWEAMLTRYPKPPASDKDRHEREDDFWQQWAKHFTWAENGITHLKPKQEIINLFRNQERWIFREFYAATGVLNKTKDEEAVRHQLAYERAQEIFDNSSRFGKDLALKEILRAEAAEEKFVRETFPAHMEKWGNWFFHGVEHAFRKMHKLDDDFGPQTAAAPVNHPAQNDLEYRPAGSDGLSYQPSPAPASTVESVDRVALEAAAEQGDVKAQRHLGLSYQTGRGGPVDIKAALRWYLMAAKQGDAMAQKNLAYLYDPSTGFETADAAESFKWYAAAREGFRAAADRGVMVGAYMIGILHKNGQGGPVDEQEALKWLLLAAHKGYTPAQTALQEMADASSDPTN